MTLKCHVKICRFLPVPCHVESTSPNSPTALPSTHPWVPNLRPQPAADPHPAGSIWQRGPSTQHHALCNKYVFMYMESSRWMMHNVVWISELWWSYPSPKLRCHTAGVVSQPRRYISYSHQGGEGVCTAQNIINMKIINMDLGAGRAHPEVMRNPWLVMLHLHTCIINHSRMSVWNIVCT